MITETVTPPPTTRTPSTTAYLLKLLAGPAAFALVLMLPLGASYQGQVALATFICAIVWWMKIGRAHV